MRRTVAELGRLDTVINNAGVMLLGPAVDAPLEESDRMVAINVLGLLYISHAAMEHVIAAAQDEPRRVADFVNISSVAGRRAMQGRASTTSRSSASAPSASRCGRSSPRATCACRWSSRARW